MKSCKGHLDEIIQDGRSGHLNRRLACVLCRVVSLNAYAPTSDRCRVTQKENINFTIPLIVCKIKASLY